MVRRAQTLPPSEPPPTFDLRIELHRAKNVLGSITLNAAVLVDDHTPAERRDKAKERLRRSVADMAKLLDALGEWAIMKAQQ